MLETLRIDGSEFSVLPGAIGNLSSLTHLYLYRTKIKTLPEAVCNLPNLKKLRLLRCAELEVLPDSIGNVRSLESLYIRGSKITALPESIGNLSSLYSLVLQYTDIASLPDSIGNLVNLRLLFISNYPEDMPWDYDIDYPPHYRENEAEEKRCPFAALPDTISKLVSLEFLKLSNTEVTVLPDYLGELPLEKLDIIDCNVETLPPSLQRLEDNGELTVHRTQEEFQKRQWGLHNLGNKRKPRRRM
jgi:Leucine-rich repeat (LRR) protein